MWGSSILPSDLVATAAQRAPSIGQGWLPLF